MAATGAGGAPLHHRAGTVTSVEDAAGDAARPGAGGGAVGSTGGGGSGSAVHPHVEAPAAEGETLEEVPQELSAQAVAPADEGAMVEKVLQERGAVGAALAAEGATPAFEGAGAIAVGRKGPAGVDVASVRRGPSPERGDPRRRRRQEPLRSSSASAVSAGEALFELVEATYLAMDSNGDGILSKSEFVRGSEKRASRKRARTVFARCDVDSDGALNFVEYLNAAEELGALAA